ncbi:MAG: ABC transporter substrate-binding protein [Lachnospiraceae bacterium]|nr:ABC transporter substrate-binding protein [Lachnospiraceae bacterium]
MKCWKKLIAMFLCFCMTVILAACGNVEDKTGNETKKISIAYQGGVGYAPVHVMEKKNLIEENYAGEITVEFVKLDSGAAINEGIIGGTIDVGCMGLAPAVSGVAAGIPYKAISNLCSQSHGLMSNDLEITALSDITSEDKIALVSTGSIQHILLAMAAEKAFGDAHALDNNIQGMSHAEGMASLESGTVKLHLTSSPFIYQERESGKYTELAEISEVWPSGNTFLVAMASTKLENDPELFDAVSKSFDQAITFINENKEEAAQIESEYLELELETVTGYLEQEDCQFFTELRGAETMVEFMYRAGFIEKEITLEDFKYESVNSNE